MSKIKILYKLTLYYSKKFKHSNSLISKYASSDKYCSNSAKVFFTSLQKHAALFNT